MTRTANEIFAPAILNASRLQNVHKIIQLWQAPYRGQRITRMFECGKINGSDRDFLWELYVEDA